MTLMKQNIVRTLVLCMAMLCGTGSVWGDEWSINFAEIGGRNSLADKAAAVIGTAVDNGMGTVTLGEPLPPNFGIQTGTTWLYRTAQKALYQGNGGNRNFGVFNAVAKQIITLDVTAAPTPTNATLRSTNGNVRTYEVTANGTVTFNLVRYEYLYSISVSDPSATDVDYTLRYVDESDNELKTSTKSGTPGESVSLLDSDKENFWKDGTKYIYVSDDAAGKTIAEDGSTVVTIQYRVANSYNYSISSNVPGVSYRGTVVEGESITVGVPRYINVDGTLYETEKNSTDWYHHTYTISQDNQTETITYTATDITNVVLYAEGEDLTGASQTSSGITPRVSMGLAGYGNNLPVTTLQAGAYKIYVHYANGNTGSRQIVFNTGTAEIATLTAAGSNNNQDLTSDVFNLIGNADITMTSEGSSAGGVDYFYIITQPTANYTVNYVDGAGNEIKPSQTCQGAVGANVIVGNTERTLKIGNVNYYYESDDSDENPIAEDGSTEITITYHGERIYHYTLKTSLNTEIASGDVVENTELYIYYPRYIVNDSKQLYSANPLGENGKEFAYAFRVTEDNQVFTIPYSDTGVRNVMQLTEGEEVDGMTRDIEGGNQSRTSNGATGYSASDVVIASGLPSGKYVLVMHPYNATQSTKFDFKVNIDGETILAFSTSTNGLGSVTSKEFGIKDESIELIMPAGFAGNIDCAIDNFYLQRVGDFVAAPTFTRNLRSSYKVEEGKSTKMIVLADNAAGYHWYKWTGTDEQYATAVSTYLAGAGEDPDPVSSAFAEPIQNANTNSYSYSALTAGEEEKLFCQAKGFGSNVYSVLATVQTIADANVESTMSPFFIQDYENTNESGWTGLFNVPVTLIGSSHAAQITNSQNGSRNEYLPLSQEFEYAPANDGLWSLDFDFMPSDNSPEELNIYNTAIANGTPSATTVVPNEYTFFALKKNGSDYDAYINGEKKGDVILTAGEWYHVNLTVDPSGTNKVSASVNSAVGRAASFSGTSTNALTTGMDLGGINLYTERQTNPVYVDNVVLKVNTYELTVSSDLAEFVESNDDEYLNDGAGLNFDVPAATQFEWYVSSVAPSKNPTSDNPKLNEDGSVTWNDHEPFMTVQTPVDRASTTIKSVNGVDVPETPTEEQLHAVAPSADNEGKYAYGPLAAYRNDHIVTVYDAARKVTVNDKDIYRYDTAPEATASGSRWHYLRQLWIPIGDESGTQETDHIDYVWCVAKNALGEVTSKVAQISIYPKQPVISLHVDDETEDKAGERDDMTIPANYIMRLSTVRIQAQNLVFNTANMPVPFNTKSEIVFRDESRNEYLPNKYPADQETQWKHGETEWTGVLSTTSFTGLDGILEANASVHGYYKNIPYYVPVDFVYGLRQLNNANPFHEIGRNGGAEYRIGPSDDASLMATQEYFFDYGKEVATPLGDVSTPTTWDWSKLPQRSYLTYNREKHAQAELKYNYVVDPESRLIGPVMGQEYIMADFYGYKPSELNGFPSDKMMLGLEYVNDPTDKCMQGNAFIFKPTAEGTLTVTFAGTGSQDNRYLELCVRDGSTETAKASYDENYENGDYIIHQFDEAKELTMLITEDMLGDGKLVVIRARNCPNQEANGLTNQYFRIYSATYTPNAATVTAKEYIADDKVDIQGADTYTECTTEQIAASQSDGFVSLHAADGAKIKYKLYEGTATVGEITDALNGTETSDLKSAIEALETQDYNPEAYTDTKSNKIGIHVRENCKIIAWAEVPGMNDSKPLVYETHAATYPVDLRFMYNFTEQKETYDTENDAKDYFNTTYWGTGDDVKTRETTDAQKAWNASQYADIEIDGIPYIADKFDKFYITHGTVIDINVMAKEGFQFDGFGAPAVAQIGGEGDDKDKYTITDMMRARAATKYARYHLLYDKAKSKNTNYIAFLIANFKDLEGQFTAQIVMKEGTDAATDPTHTTSLNVDNQNRIVAPVYHSAHDADGRTVVMWTKDHSARDENNIVIDADNEIYSSYLPGDTKKIYENTFIKPVYRNNTLADNYRARATTMDAEWWFTTDKNAQTLTLQNEYAGFNMPYVTPVRRHQIGSAAESAADDIWFDLPMTISLGSTGRLNNTAIADWCSVGRGTTFTVPACKGAVVSMEVRSPLSLTDGGTTFGGELPELWKVKYKNEDYVETQTPDAAKTVESYIYKYECPDDWGSETLDIVMGNDYSYLRRIGLSMPPINHNRDAALITLHLDELPKLGEYGEGNTGDGYEFVSHEHASLYKAHYSKELGAIYHKDVTYFDAQNSVADNVPYVNGIVGYTRSTTKDGTFIVGPFRSITHIRYQQGCSVLGGGGWTMTVGRKTDYDPAQRSTYTVESFNGVQWSEAKYGSLHNTTTPEWVEMDIQEHIYPNGSNKDDHSLIDDPNFDTMQGNIFLRFQADKADVYLFAIEIYGIDPTADQQVTLETGVLAAQKDDDTQYEPSLRAGSIFHFPYLLQLDENYQPISSVKGSDNKVMQYNEGRDVTLTATANLGYEFLKWVKPDGTEVSTENPYKFNINENTELRAVFVHRGIINYITSGTNYGHAPELQQTDAHGGFSVAENRGMFSAEGMSLRQWQDAEPLHQWYSGDGAGKSSLYDVSTNHINSTGTGNVTTESHVEVSRAETGIQVDVFPQFSANTLSLLDVTGRKGVAARWQFGKGNGAPTMVGNGATPQLVTQMAIASTKDVVNEQTGAVTTTPVNDIIDVKMGVSASINNAGRADVYATVGGVGTNCATFTLPATKGMKVEIGAQGDIEYRIDGGDWQHYTGAFNHYGTDATITLELRNKETNQSTFELDYIQATYFQRAQTPVLSMQKVDVIGEEATNNIQVQVQTSTNPNAVRFYTIDGSDPVYVMQDGYPIPGNSSTRQVRGNYITINEAQIGEGTTLKVLSMCTDRADSEIATLDLEPYDSSLGLATYVYDSRFINIHEDQIFKKLMDEHEGHFNLLSYDLNPDAAVIPTTITDHTTVFITSDAVCNHLMTALTNPSDPAAHGQKFNTKPLIVGTPLMVYWNEGYDDEGNIVNTIDNPQDPTGSGWQGMSWVSPTEPIVTTTANATTPATHIYTEFLSTMKEQVIRDDLEDDNDETNRTYSDYYETQIAETGDKYILAFFDNMLFDGSKVCISNSTSNAPEYLNHNGTQLVFNATELLTRITEVDGVKTPADVSTYNKTLLAMMAPTKNPQLVNVSMTMTGQVTDVNAGSALSFPLSAPMLGALADGYSEMATGYLASSYPQFTASAEEGWGIVTVKNIEVATEGDYTSEKLGAKGIEDLATIITVTNQADATFERNYRIEYNIPIEEVTFHKVDGKWVCDESDLCSITETKDADGQPSFKLVGPINYGIKDVCFNGYALAPANKFDANGELLPDEEGQHDNSIWGKGEKYDENAMASPTAYSVTGNFIHEYPEGYEGEKTYLPAGQWMESHFPWGYHDCYRMAFTLLNITEYVGDIKVRYYRRQADSPQLIHSNIYNDAEVEANGSFVLEFNSVMHEVRVPGRYGNDEVIWTAHIIPDDLGNGVTYEKIKDDNRKIDQYDTETCQIRLTAEGGSNVLTFHYWHLEAGKKYWLHIPFSILRGAVGEGIPYEYPADEASRNEYEKLMSVTKYVGTDSKAIPYFDIPFTVKSNEFAHATFSYIVDRNDWWDAYKESGSQTCANKLPDYAKWDGDFKGGINQIMAMKDNKEHPYFYMHVQKNSLDGDGNPIPYSYGTGDAGLMHFREGNFSIVGEGSDSTLITAQAEQYHGGTFTGLSVADNINKSTIRLDADNVYLQGIHIRNTQEGESSEDGQEYPALFDRGNRNVLYDVDVDAYEETFAVFGSLSYLEKCKVSGYGDFILGSGDVWLEDCDIVLRNRASINLCAPSTLATNKWGFVFNGCTIDREAGASLVLDHNWTLARPWEGYDPEVLKSPSVNFLNTEFKVLPTQGGYGELTEGLHLRFHEYGSTQNGQELALTTRSIANCMPEASSDYPVITEDQSKTYTIEGVFGRDNGGYDPQALTKQAEAPVLTNDGMVLHWKANPADLCYLVYYLGDGVDPDWQHAQMFCCVPGTDNREAYCYLTNHDESPIFRTGDTDKPISFSEMWYGKRKVNGSDEAYSDDPEYAIPGMGKASPTRLWFAVRAANQMGGLSPMSNPLKYQAARQYRTTISEGGKKQDDDSNAYSTIYLDFQARAPKGVKVYALTDVTAIGGEGTTGTTLTFSPMGTNYDNHNHQDVVYAHQGYLIYGPCGSDSVRHIFVETTAEPDIPQQSYLTGTVGSFRDRVSETGYGERNNERLDGDGWSISSGDYDNISATNISAYTLQKYDSRLGFYNFTGITFRHHRAYLDTETAARVLSENQGLSQQDAMQVIARGMRIRIIDEHGVATDITSVFRPAGNATGIYDLLGRRIPSTHHLIPGTIYIIDGKKVLW